MSKDFGKMGNDAARLSMDTDFISMFSRKPRDTLPALGPPVGIPYQVSSHVDGLATASPEIYFYVCKIFLMVFV